MTIDTELGPRDRFVRAFLPWLVAAGALAVYLITLNRWVSLSSLPQVARVSGWTWQPEIYGPLFWLITYPFRWLPASLIPLALNCFAAVCAVLTLALLARSVALLPQDRTDEQRRHQSGRSSLLSVPNAWLPPVLAAMVCGLQLTFWEHATAVAAPAPPWGAGCEMFDLLLFAYVVRCLLEYRLDERESWLLRAAFVFGAAMTNNWGMIGFFPAFIVALVWIRGLSFFNLRFLARMSVCGLAGLLFYLLLPLLLSGGDASVPFWPALKANLNSQRGILMTFYKYGRQEVALLALTSLVPVFIMGIRWASYFGDTSKLGVALATFMFHVVHGLFLVACIWVALDPPFSPRNKGFGAPFLTFYYLGALVVGYCSGYFLLLFGGKRSRPNRLPPYQRFINRVITGALWLLLVLTPLALICRNLPQILTTNGPMLKRFAEQVSKGLPPGRAVLLADDSRRLLLFQAFAVQNDTAKNYLFLDTGALVYPDYHRFLKRSHPQAWESDPPKHMTQRAEPLLLVHLLSRLAQTNSVYYLHPSFGYYFEFFYQEPHGLAYKLTAYPTNHLLAPALSKELVAWNEAFWETATRQALQPLLAIVAPPSSRNPGLVERLFERAHLAREPNHDATALAAFYSRALDYWGVELQKYGRLTNAAARFETALELNPDNLVAQVNLQCNQNLREGLKSSVQVSKSIEDEFGKYRSWEQIMGENGPFDEPNFCYEQGRAFVQNNLYRQAAAQFDRVRVLDPGNLAARIWLGQLYVVSQMPDRALQLIAEIRAQPSLAEAASTNRTELLFVETSAHLAREDLRGAEATVQSAIAQQPTDANLLATATRVYMNYGRFSNALAVIERELQLAPTNMNALVNKGYACIQVGAFDQAIPPLTRALTMDTNNHSALLNRAIAYLQADQLESSQHDYEVLQKAFPTAFQIYYGLGEIAWRKRDTNAAMRNYQLYLANAPTNTHEAKIVSARLKELTPGSP